MKPSIASVIGFSVAWWVGHSASGTVSFWVFIGSFIVFGWLIDYFMRLWHIGYQPFNPE